MGVIEDRFRPQPNRGPGQIAALWTGTITDVRSDGRVRARIPRLGSSLSLGPMITYVAGVDVGDPVIIGAMAGQYSDLAVLAFADKRVPLSGAVGREIMLAETTAEAKTAAGLGNVDNTSDLAKPVSTAVALALGNKSNLGHTHLWADLTDKPATFAPTIGTTATTAKAGNWLPSWSEVQSKPTTFAPSAHTHLWADLTDKPATFTPSAHTHLWAHITDKPATFAPSAHTHLWADITDKPATFAPSAHTHAGADVAAATTLLSGTMSAADKVKLDGAASVPTASAMVIRDAAARAQFADPAAAQDAATKAYADRWLNRRAEYFIDDTSYTAGSVGTFTSIPGTGKTVGAAFSAVHPSAHSSIVINETGFYSASAFVVPNGDPLGAWLRITLYNANGTIASVLGQNPNGQSYCWETMVSLSVPEYIVSGQYLRIDYSAGQAHTYDLRVKVWKMGALGAWGL